MKKNLLNLMLCASIMPCAAMANEYPINTYINGGDPFTLKTVAFYNGDYGKESEFMLGTNEPVDIISDNSIYYVDIDKADSSAYAMKIVIVNTDNDTVYQSNSIYNNGEFKTEVLKTAEIVSEPWVRFGVKSDSVSIKGDSLFGYFNNVQAEYFDGKDTLLLGEPYSGTIVLRYTYSKKYIYKVVEGNDTTDYSSYEKINQDGFILIDSVSEKFYDRGYSIIALNDFWDCDLINGGSTIKDLDYEHPYVIHIDYATKKQYFDTKDLSMNGGKNQLYPMFRGNEKLDSTNFSPNGYTFYINYYNANTLKTTFGDLSSIQLADIENLSSGVKLIFADEQVADGPVYDLAGRKVENIEAERIYIQNGKKFMIKQ